MPDTFALFSERSWGCPIDVVLQGMPGLKARILRAVIVSGSPVCGFRPLRLFFSLTTKLPKPVISLFQPSTRQQFVDIPPVNMLFKRTFS